MQLDLADFPVREIRFGKSYRYQSGTLELDREDLTRLVLRDERIEEARFETVSPGELKEFLAGRFAKFWVPDGYDIIETIPKTSVGKFLKSALREKYEQDHSVSG